MRLPENPLPAVGRLSGTGRVTVARTGGAAPGWGAYALLYTTRLTGRQLEAIVAATVPEAVDSAWGLHRSRPHGPVGSECRSLLEYAVAIVPEQLHSEPPAAYQRRLAAQLLRLAMAGRMVRHRGAVDLPVAWWEVDVDHSVDLATKHAPAGWAGHARIHIGRLVTVTAKKEEPARG